MNSVDLQINILCKYESYDSVMKDRGNMPVLPLHRPSYQSSLTVGGGREGGREGGGREGGREGGRKEGGRERESHSHACTRTQCLQ